MSLNRSSRTAGRVLAVVVTLGFVASACQPGSPSVVPTASFQTAIDGYSYSATSPLWTLEAATGHYVTHPSSQIGMTLRDPTNGLSGVFTMSLWLDTGGPVIEPGTYDLGPEGDDIEIGLRIETVETFLASLDHYETYEVKWRCHNDPDSFYPGGSPRGSVTVTSVTFRGDDVSSIGLSWDLVCTSHFWLFPDNFSHGTDYHWVGSATYNS